MSLPASTSPTPPPQVVLLRNRDRIQLLWPPVMDHLTAIIRGKREHAAPSMVYDSMNC